MQWYDIFSLFYDASLETLYREARTKALSHLQVQPFSYVLDLACGTGQNFNFIAPHLEKGQLVGLDASAGMLKRARRRIQKNKWPHASVVQLPAHSWTPETLQQKTGLLKKPDRIVCTLGFSAFPEWESILQQTIELLEPNGRLVIMDVHAESRLFQTRTVEWMARADLSRKIWVALEKELGPITFEYLPGDPKTFGGRLYVAAATKPC